MKRSFGLLVLLLLTSASAHAGTEIFVGYTYGTSGAGRVDREIAHGWSVDVTHTFFKYVGLTSDFAGVYGNVVANPGVGPCAVPVPPPACFQNVSFQSYTLLGGPRLIVPIKPVSVFVQVLWGVSVTRLGCFTAGGTTVPSAMEADFAMGYGAGLDLNLLKFLAIRPIQYDHIRVKVANNWIDANTLRAGVVFKF